MGQDSQSCGMMGTPDRHPRAMHEQMMMHEQTMKDMQTDLDSMRSNLQKMKDQLGKVSDRGAKDQLQLNIDMWQSFIDHMDKHMATMRKMMDSRKGASTDETKHEHEHAPATPAQ
jgi:predicted  nucleic acid-binding Zn-ribbon protein